MQRLALAGPLRPAGRSRPLPRLRPGLVRRLETAQLTRPGAARADRPDGGSREPAARDAARRPALPALRRQAEDGPQPVALGPLVAAAVRAPPRRLPVVRAVPRGEGPAAADVADRSRQAAARPRPDRLHQLRRRDRQGRRALPLVPLDPEPARRRPPRACARPARHDRAARRPPAPRRARARCSARPAARRCPTGQTISCSQCGATLAITSLAEAHAQVQALAPALRAAAARPSPDVVKRRLDALDEDLPRRREWVAADAGRGRRATRPQRRRERLGRGSSRAARKPVRAVLAIAFVVWIAWPAGAEASLSRRDRAAQARPAPLSAWRRAVIGTLARSARSRSGPRSPRSASRSRTCRRSCSPAWRWSSAASPSWPLVRAVARPRVDARCSASTACSAITSCCSSRCATRRRSRPTSSTTSGRCSSSCWRRCSCRAALRPVHVARGGWPASPARRWRSSAAATLSGGLRPGATSPPPASAFIWASYSLLTQRVAHFPTAAIGLFGAGLGLLALACHALLEPAVALLGARLAADRAHRPRPARRRLLSLGRGAEAERSRAGSACSAT